LQYRAFKDASVHFGELLYAAPPRVSREVGLDPELLTLLPDVTLNISTAHFAELAVRAMTPKVPESVSVTHIHAPAVSVREQAAIIATQLQRGGQMSFRSLIRDCPDVLHIVARFLALLELFRESAVTFEQAGPLSELLVRWTAVHDADVSVTDEFDDDLDQRSSDDVEKEHENE